MIRSKVDKQDLVSVLFDVSYKYQGKHKEVSALLPHNIPTVDLNATSNYKLFPVDPTDDKKT